MLPNHRHIVAPGHGHIVSPSACAPRLIAAFVDDAGFATLPADCVRQLEGSDAAGVVDRPARPRIAVIDVDNVVKTFGKRGEVRAVDGVSFVAPGGQITGLLGPNGAGQDDAAARARHARRSPTRGARRSTGATSCPRAPR